jgi:hypothetical protein
LPVSKTIFSTPILFANCDNDFVVLYKELGLGSCDE